MKKLSTFKRGKILTRLTSAICALALVFVAAMPAINVAAASNTIYLKGSGSSFKDEGWRNVFYVNDEVKSATYPNVWHLVYTGDDFSDVSEMQLTFTNGAVFNWTPDMGPSVNNGGNNPGWVIVAPYDWSIAYVDKGNNNASDSFLVTNDKSNVNFNISGFNKGKENDPSIPSGYITIQKTVGGELFGTWTTDVGVDAETLIAGMNFSLYKANPTGTAYDSADFITDGIIDIDGTITFTGLDLEPGWYAVVESLSGLAADIFDATGPQYFFIGAKGNNDKYPIGNYQFDVNAKYYVDSSWVAMGGNGIPIYTEFSGGMVWDGVKDGHENATARSQANEVQGITVRTSMGSDFEEYASFCAHVGSWAYSESGYKPAVLDPDTYADILSAFNYIADAHPTADISRVFGLNGKPNDARILAQMAVWYLLPADAENFTVTEIRAKGEQYDALNAEFLEMLEASKGYTGHNTIIGLAYLTSLNGTIGDSQPQLVPIFAGEALFNNTPDESAFLGSLTVDVDITTAYDQKTYQPYWQKKLQPIWQKTYQPIWQKELQPVWQKTYQPIWQRTYQPFWQRTYQLFSVPVFVKGDVSSVSGTLVTRLEYTEPYSAKSTPTNGGAFKNGHTYVAVDVAAASTEGGVWYTIADSSFNANGKKTPNEYNTPIDYQYNVKIKDGKLTISFDDRLISASVGAYAVANINEKDKDFGFPGNAPKHSANSVTIDVPTDSPKATAAPTATTTQNGDNVTIKVGSAVTVVKYEKNAKKTYSFDGYTVVVEYNGNGVKSASVTDYPKTESTVKTPDTIYLYMHMEGVKWYTTSNYKFKGYQLAEELSVKLSDKLKYTDLVSDEYVRTDLVSNKYIRTDLASDAFVRNKLVKNAFVRNKLISDRFVKNKLVNTEHLTKSYEDAVNLIITNSLNEVVYEETFETTVALKNASLPLFDPGDYTVTLNVAGQEFTEDVTIVEREIAAVSFGELIVKGKADKVYLDKTYLPAIFLKKTYLKDKLLKKTYLKPIVLKKTYLDDKELDKTYLEDIKLEKKYLEDIKLGPIELGKKLIEAGRFDHWFIKAIGIFQN
ncbi:DUF4816 domain-containing protein [Candidatus Saccharibacteria bacterium]|nr:DUF4816 domain-containing protein [Candidatus Saccharibacteria bacterium]